MDLTEKKQGGVGLEKKPVHDKADISNLEKNDIKGDFLILLKSPKVNYKTC